MLEMPNSTGGEKKDMMKWANQELRRLGLAVKCPRSGKESWLIAAGDRVCIEIRGKPHRRSFQTYYLDRLLEKLELMPATRENLTWVSHLYRDTEPHGEGHKFT